MAENNVIERFHCVVGFSIRQWESGDDTFEYDWVATTGDESEELFETAKEARRDAESRF